VDTVEGQKKISDMVGTSGELYCYDEINKEATIGEYFDVRQTQKNADVYLIELEDGREIKATDYHPVLTLKGWKLVKDLITEDIIIDISLPI
jgi:intein/homing endonuclease